MLFFKNLFIYLFIYLWLCWVFVSVQGPSLVAASGGHSSSRCAGLSLSRPLLLRSTGSRHAGSAIVAHGPSCSVACGSSQTRAQTHVPCIGRQTLNHCATREAPWVLFLYPFSKTVSLVGAFNPFTFKVIIDMYVPMTIFLIVFGFVFVGPFLLLCFPLREVPLAFVVELVWWCSVLLAFACL